MERGSGKRREVAWNGAPGVSAVERAMLIFEALTESPHGLTITDLSARLGINKGLVHRILASLAALGYVAKDDLTQHYRLTTRMLGLAFSHLRVVDVYDVLLPILRRLAHDTGELAELNWLDRGRLVLVLKADSPRRVKVVDYLGEEQHPHATATGKVWLATLPEVEVRRLLAERGMPRLTEHTITDLDRFLAELEIVREQGYAINVEESGRDVVAVAAAVHAHGGAGQVIGAISVVAPAHRPIYRDARVIELTRAAAREISEVWPFLSLGR